MSWIVNKQSSQEELAERFRKLMCAPEILQIPGAHDGMAALLAKEAGFSALYLSGAAYTASRGRLISELLRRQKWPNGQRSCPRKETCLCSLISIRALAGY